MPGLNEQAGSPGIGWVEAVVTGQPTDTGYYIATVTVTDEHGVFGKLQFGVQVDFVTDVEPISGSPTEFALYQNYPNPFNPVTTISYNLPQSQDVYLVVYNLLGQEVAVLVNEYQTLGLYQVQFSAQELPSGTYFYRLTAGSYLETKKMTVLK